MSVLAVPSGIRRGASRYAIFFIIIALTELSPALPHSITPNKGWWLLSVAFLVVMVLTGWLAERQQPSHWLNTVAPLILLPALWALRCADGNSASGFTPLIFLPVVWFALYGRLSDVVLAVVTGAATIFLPIVIIGSPRYPVLGWRGYTLLVIMTATLGPLIHRLVESTTRASSALIRSEREFRAAFEDAPVGMAITGLRGEYAHRFVRVNHELCRMFGRPEAELIGMELVALTHPDDVDLTNYVISTATDPVSQHRVEKRYLHRSGRTIWTSVSFSVIHDEHGEATHLISQIEDIASRRESDQALLEAFETDRQATELLSQLDRMRSEMASTVSHEMRTPLTSAAGYVELLAEGDAGPLTEEQRTMLDTVGRSLTRLDGIVGDVLGLTGNAQLQRREVGNADLGAVVASAVETVALQAAARGQDLVTHNELHGIRVFGNAGRLERAVLNLLTNAVKFTPQDGTITVSGHRHGADATISVTDTGVGISPADQQRVFERFFRADGRRADVATPGSGLGLAIVSTIMTQYGGTIDLQSEPGVGSTFTLTFPVPADH